MSALDLDRRTLADLIEVLTGAEWREPRARAIRDYAAGRIGYSVHAREAYSYGRHFPLFRYVPRGTLGSRRDCFVLNGDRWGGAASRTSDHQEMSRELAAATGAACVVIPFSTLDGAGIDLDSIRPLAVEPDRWEDVDCSARALEDVPEWLRVLAIEIPCTADTFAAVNPAKQRVLAFEPNEYGRYVQVFKNLEPGPDGLYRWNEPTRVPLEPGADGLYHYTRREHRLGEAVFSAVRRETGRRARYLSGFDSNEPAPLYFLAELPRGAAAGSVGAARDSLAPRAVHAAIARGREVQRQGDVFFIRTELSDIDIELRKVSRARLTQWTLSARARRGEVGYSAPLTADRRRTMDRYARRRFHEILQDALERTSRGEGKTSAPLTDPGSRRKHAKARADAAKDLDRAREVLRRSAFGLRPYGRETRNDRYVPSVSTAYYRAPSPLQNERNGYRVIAVRAREILERVRVQAANAELARCRMRDRYRVTFRAGPAAVVAWNMARAEARARFDPEGWHGPTIERRRERVRKTLAVYGTAHSATEVVRARGGAVYVRGTVRHVPDLEPGRVGGVDHRPLRLADGSWYLAVRNTVPRLPRRRRRSGAAS